MNAPLSAPRPEYVTIAGNYKGKKFDSPNDATYRKNGDLFFTDPPYGLEKYIDDPLKEAPYQGVYKVDRKGKVTLLLDTITRPNGIVVSADQKTLIVANSDPEKPYWYAFDFGPKDSLINPRIFHDPSAAVARKESGLPDGMKVDRKGNVFATGPGGIWIFDSKGTLLGRVRLKGPTSNCALADNDKTLYVTADMDIIRIRMRP